MPEFSDEKPEGIINVWVMEHDDPEVRWVINTRAEMEDTFDDLLDSQNEQVVLRVGPDDVTFAASDLIRRAYNDLWEQEFERWAQSWTHLEMPLDVYFGNTEDERNWVSAQLADDAIMGVIGEVLRTPACEVDDCENPATPCACGAAHCSEHPHQD